MIRNKNIQMLADLLQMREDSQDEGIRLRLEDLASNLYDKIIQETGNTPDNLTHEEKRIFVRDGKIACIKAVRTRTGLGLKDAKDLVEDYERDNPAF